MLFPVESKFLNKCRFSSPFGMRIHPIRKTADGHRGIDIGMPTNTQLRAIEDGTVRVSTVNNGGSSKGYGYFIVVNHTNGYHSLYAHLSSLSIYKVGDKVKKGQVIAYSGNTGSSTGPHLHFETHKGDFKYRSQVKNKDTAMDPLEVYPELKGMLGKYLTNVKFKDNIVPESKSEEFKVKILYKGTHYKVDGYVKEQRNYVQLREVFEALGFKVGWNNETKEVIIEEE